MPKQTMGQYNQNFMANNPQFGSTARPLGSAPQQGMSSYIPNNQNPMGIKANNPQANIVQPKTTLAPSQAVKTNQTATVGNAVGNANNTGYLGSPSALSYSNYVGSLGGFNPNEDPEVKAALQRQRDFEGNYANLQQNIGSRPNPFGFMTGVGALEKNRYASLSPVYQSQVQQAYTGAGQRLGALQAATGASAPVQVSPGNFYVSPTSGQDISGGAISPFTGGMRQAQVTAGGSYLNNNTSIAQARNLASGFSQLLAQTPDYNVDPVNVWNSLKSFLKQNVSNPKYAQLENQLRNIVGSYSTVLGPDQMNSMIQGSQAGSLNEFLQNLDRQAQTYNDAVRSVGTGGAVPQAPQYTTPQPTNQPSVSGVTPSGIKYTVIQ